MLVSVEAIVNSLKIKKAYRSQWLTGSITTVLVIVTGLMSGWCSPYLAQLTSLDLDAPLRLTVAQASWVASLISVGRIIGAILCVVLQEYVGRNRTLLISSIPMALSWIFIVMATSVPWLYAARICSGICIGMVWAALPMFLGEIADPAVRGSLVALNVNAVTIGILLGNIMGPNLSLKVFACVSLVPNIFFTIVFFFVPESPYYYISTNQINRAEQSLKWFHPEANTKKEMEKLQDFVTDERLSSLQILKEFGQPRHLKSAFFIMSLYFFMNFCGINTIVFYAEIIVTKSQISITPSTVVIAMGVVAILSGSMATVLVDRFGRKSLLITSTLGAGVSLVLLGLHFHLLSLDTIDPQNLTWLPVLSLLLFNIFVSYGLLPISSTLLSELFPPNIRTMAGFGASLAGALYSFIATKTFQPFLDLVGEKYVFWTSAIISFIAVPFSYFLVPETTGKTLMDIQTLIASKN